jgi:NADH-quinone oxidoreductase subunit B
VWRGAQRVFAVESMALACCAAEVAQGCAQLDLLTEDAVIDGSVLLISGTVSVGSLPTVVARFEAMPQPRYVVAFGACATSGGPYWDSYSVIPGIGTELPVDVVVPGCPPRPDLVQFALRELENSLEGL